MKKTMRRIALVLVLALMATCFAACGKSEFDSDLEYVQDKGKLVVGITNFEPMDYPDGNGSWIGFDADMAKAFAKSLGVEVEFVEIVWDNKVMELDDKGIDCVWNGMTLTDAVKNAMSTSNAYCLNAQVVVVKSDVADQYQDAEGIKCLDFVVEGGSAGAEELEALGIEYLPAASQADALMEVSAGTSDACVSGLLMAGAMMGEGTAYARRPYAVSLNSEEYGVGFRKGSDLTQKLNEFFAAAYADGTMQELATLYGVQESVIAQ